MRKTNFLTSVSVSAEGARMAIAAAESEARLIGKALTIAVADGGGDLIALHRMDGAVLCSIESAMIKARTVIRIGQPSKVLQDMLDEGNLSVMLIPGTVAMGGAVPIVLDGQIIGAVAASGDTVETDVRVAEAGARAVTDELQAAHMKVGLKNGMDTRKVATAFFERMAANQFAEAFDMMDENVVYTVIGSTPISGVFNGKKELFERLIPALNKFKDPVIVTVKEYVVEGDRAVVLTAGVGEAPFGHYVQDPCVFVLRVREGRIVDLLEFVDTVMLETRMFGSTLTRRQPTAG
jgi:uncharacterized protein GlcG (DUF336 family)/ketosteroid isomerase-like protein